MKQAVFRERNKQYYRVLHTPIWFWVFWVLPGFPLTYDLYAHGPDRRHWIWLAVVVAVVVWRGRLAAGQVHGPGASAVGTSETSSMLDFHGAVPSARLRCQVATHAEIL